MEANPQIERVSKGLPDGAGVDTGHSEKAGWRALSWNMMLADSDCWICVKAISAVACNPNAISHRRPKAHVLSLAARDVSLKGDEFTVQSIMTANRSREAMVNGRAIQWPLF